MRFSHETYKNATVGDVEAWARRASTRTILREAYWLRYVPHGADALVRGLRDRGAEDRRAFVDGVYRSGFVMFDHPEVVAARALIRDGLAQTSDPEYLLMARRAISHRPDDGRSAADYGLDLARFVERDLWLTFSVDGAGTPALPGELERFLEFAAARPELRARMLDASLDGLLHDFTAHRTTWHRDVHRGLTPTRDEVLERERRYVAVLASPHAASVRLAVELLDGVLEGIAEPDALLDASRIVLARRDKNVVLAHARVLAALAAQRAESRADVLAVAREAAAMQQPDVAERIARIVGVESTAAHSASPPVEGAGGTTVVVPGPRRGPHLPLDAAPPIDDVDELGELLVELLERDAVGEELRRAVGAIVRFSRMRPATASALAARVGALLPRMSHGIEAGWQHSAPREYLAMLVGVWLDADFRFDPSPGFMFYSAHGPLPWIAPRWPDAPDESKSSFFDRLRALGERLRGDTSDTRHTAQLITVRGGIVDVPSPRRVHAAWLIDVASAIRSGRASLVHAELEAMASTTPEAARWERRLLTELAHEYDGSYSKLPDPPFLIWVDLDEPAASSRSVRSSFFDLRLLELTFQACAGQTRDRQGEQTLLAWMHDVLRHDLDRFAAHALPALAAAAGFVNVDTGVVTDALSGARRPLGPPANSAVALALSAREQSSRVRAAEMFSDLCMSGMLDPVALGERMAAELQDGVVKASRVASSLTDAASISAIAGWRALELLVTLLPTLRGVRGAGDLLALAARLANEYGVEIDVPDPLRSTNGSGPTALAVRALRASTARETHLAHLAAEQASAALVGTA